MGTSRNCLLNTFIKNVQIIGACNWSYKRKWNRKLNTEWENKYKQRNVDSWVECENSSVLEWTWLLHLPKGIRTIFKLHYWTKIRIKYKKCIQGLSGTALSVCLSGILAGNQDMFHTWVRFLTRSFHSVLTQMISAIFVGSWKVLACKLGMRQELASFWKICLRCCIVEQKEKKSVDNQPWVYRGSKNHRSEVRKTEVSSIVASWEQYNSSLSINEFFFRI